MYGGRELARYRIPRSTILEACIQFLSVGIPHVSPYTFAIYVSDGYQLSTYGVKYNSLHLMKLLPQSILDVLKNFKTLSSLLIVSLMLILVSSLGLVAVVGVVCFGS